LDTTQYLLPTSALSNFVRLQSKYSEADYARQAVMLEISVLEQMKQKGLRDEVFQPDEELGKAYTRLAMIEEGAGQVEASRSALAEARTHYEQSPSRSGKEPTDDEMKKIITLIDKAADSL
jgi:hypothetical protein